MKCAPNLAEQFEQSLLAIGDRRNAFEPCKKVCRNGFIAMDVHRKVDAGFVHRIADAKDLRAFFLGRRMPLAIEIGANCIGSKMAAS